MQLPAPVGPFSFNFDERSNNLCFSAHTAGYTHKFHLQREHVPTDPRNVGIWYGTEDRTAADGRKWTHWMPDHVVDDFGTLVPVTGGAA